MLLPRLARTLVGAASVTALVGCSSGLVSGRATVEGSSVSPPQPAVGATLPRPALDATATTTVVAVPPDSRVPNDDRSAGWVARENQRAGTDAWRITAQNPSATIEGYARTTSASPGADVPLYISTTSPSFDVEVYRMGWYGGREGRLVWGSASLPGQQQLAGSLDPGTGLVVAHWRPVVSLAVGSDWLPGDYLIKLVSAGGDQSYIPLTVRDDHAVADMLVVNAVTTWQAYNPWGGCSLYRCYVQGAPSRAVKVSFDRPYLRTWHGGSADFLDHELPLVAVAEQQGYDLAYATSIDLDQDPSIARSRVTLLSMGHDEYYSAPMRSAVSMARDAGVNLAFFGANALYRHIRLEAGADGLTDRVEVNYRESRDPIAATDRSAVTSEWRLQGFPEAPIVGIQYACANLDTDMVIADSSSWIWHGAGVVNGQRLRGVIGTEADVMASSSPRNLDVLSASPIRCRGHQETARTSYYAAPSGAGVFASGTIWWVCALEAVNCSDPANIPAIREATINVLRAFSVPRAGRTHPSGRG